MKKSLLTLFIFFSLFSGAQNPLVKMWDRRFGGNAFEIITSFQLTYDSAYILAGYTRSGNFGDKSQPNFGPGKYDFWIIKIDSSNNKIWDKDFGGTGEDWLYSVVQTKDHGYLLAGWSTSTISGNKTQDTVGIRDYWIVKIDSVGNKQWDKDFGGTKDDYLSSAYQTSDGGYILGGYSSSGISGDKTQDTIGSSDFWIIKIDSLGNKQWDRDFGGRKFDGLLSMCPTHDNGYILGGYSWSDISGDKTFPNWDTSLNTSDFWILKIDSSGNKEWDKVYGGVGDDRLMSVHETKDHGLILGGYSGSGISGNKTLPLKGGVSDWDYWIVKTDSIGTIQWDKDFGGIDREYSIGNVSQISDGGYLVSGVSESDSSGDKTQFNLAFRQSWVIKLDSLGNKTWDRTLLNNGKVTNAFGLETIDGCFTFVNSNGATIGGDKTQAPWALNGINFWMIKFCETFQASFTANSNLCPGTCVDFLNLSTQAISFQWSFPSASQDTSTEINPTNICYANPGSYDVQLIATNANGSDTLLLTNYITVYPFPPPQSITQSGDTLFAISGTGTYQWYFNTNIINGATDYFYVAQASGDYNVVATDGNGCEVEAAVFNVVAGLTPALSEGEGVHLYPNPVGDEVIIQKLEVKRETALEISIYNIIGERVLNVKPQINEDEQQIIDVGTLHSGMYWLEIKSEEKIFRSKFIKAGNR